jgi:hypothetical protein
MMNEKELKLKEFLNTITFDKVSKMRITSDFVILEKLPEDYESHLYLTLIDSNKPMNRYLGWHESYFDGTYVGSPATHHDTFWKDLRKYDSITVCLSAGLSSNINPLETTMLTSLHGPSGQGGAKENPEYFNMSNAGGAKTKGRKSINALENIVYKLDTGLYPIASKSKDILDAITYFQVREHPEVPGKVQAILDLIKDTKGKWLEKNHKYVLILEDFSGKGKHVRIGSFHTLKACMKTEWVEDIKAIYIPKNDWKHLAETEIKDLGHTDNKKDDNVSTSVSESEGIANAVKYCQENNVSHKDDSVKGKFKRWGFGDTEWSRIRPKLRLKVTGKRVIPIDHIRINYTPNDLADIVKGDINETTHAFIMSTVSMSNKWNDWETFIKNTDNINYLKKPIWKIRWIHKQDAPFENWTKVTSYKNDDGVRIFNPTKKTVVEGMLTTLVEKFDEDIRPQLHFEDLPYTKLNTLEKNDKKAA